MTIQDCNTSRPQKSIDFAENAQIVWEKKPDTVFVSKF